MSRPDAQIPLIQSGDRCAGDHLGEKWYQERRKVLVETGF
jgi:hypothetical protein